MLFVKLEMLVQHLLIDNGSQRKFIARFDLLQTGGKNHMTNVLVIIQILVLNLNYHKLVKTLFAKQVSARKKQFCCGEGDCRKAKRICHSTNS